MKIFRAILTLSATFASAVLIPSASAEQSSGGESLPNIAVTEQLIQKYLSAELSFQRGDKFAAYSTMMSLARSLRDPRLARRGLEFAIAGSLGRGAEGSATLA